MVYTLYILCLPDLIHIIYFSREEGMVDMVGLLNVEEGHRIITAHNISSITHNNSHLKTFYTTK